MFSLVLATLTTIFIMFYCSCSIPTLSVTVMHRSLSEETTGEMTMINHRQTLTYDHMSGSQPIMYTFYKLKEEGGGDTLGDQALLELWTEKWTEAGWDARILTLADAMKHPKFDEYEEKLNQVPMMVEDLYNRYCFYRWIAVAAVGGGWMSDMDVLPLNFQQPDDYFQDGRFAIYSRAPRGGIPCLMSGSQNEWERLAFATVENGVEHSNEYFWTDMFATVDLYHQNPETYELLDLMGEVTNVVWNEEKCNEYNQKLAVHFAHSAVHKIGLRNINKRAEFAQDWLDEWKSSCEDFATVDTN